MLVSYVGLWGHKPAYYKTPFVKATIAMSRIKFACIFVMGAFTFLFITTTILDQPPGSFFATDSPVAWKAVVSTILSPIKLVLIGPLLPFIDFLHQDPDTPPPFFLAGFVFYWTILALVLHFIAGKLKHGR